MSQATAPEIRLTRRQPYFMLNNSVFDSGLAAEIGPHAFACYAYLCRRSGQSTSAWPSQATIAKNAGISTRMVDKCIQTLESSNLIRRDGWNGRTREIAILDPPETAAPHATSAQDAINSAPHADVPLHPMQTIKTQLIKTQDKETLSDIHPALQLTIHDEPIASEDHETATIILADILAINPKHKQPNLEKWETTLRLMRTRDERTTAEIRELWKWANAHRFWSGNILSPDKLRAQWDRLVIQKGNETKQAKVAGQPYDKHRASIPEHWRGEYDKLMAEGGWTGEEIVYQLTNFEFSTRRSI